MAGARQDWWEGFKQNYLDWVGGVNGRYTQYQNQVNGYYMTQVVQLGLADYFWTTDTAGEQHTRDGLIADAQREYACNVAGATKTYRDSCAGADHAYAVDGTDPTAALETAGATYRTDMAAHGGTRRDKTAAADYGYAEAVYGVALISGQDGLYINWTATREEAVSGCTSRRRPRPTPT